LRGGQRRFKRSAREYETGKPLHDCVVQRVVEALGSFDDVVIDRDLILRQPNDISLGILAPGDVEGNRKGKRHTSTRSSSSPFAILFNDTTLTFSTYLMTYEVPF
jgi:hypothetical protein